MSENRIEPEVVNSVAYVRMFVSTLIQATFDAKKINWWKSLAESPDMNPIEKVYIAEELLERETLATEHD